jgi:hypothetical protein
MSEFGSFSDLASVKGNTVEKPKNLPDGFYICMITGPFKEHKAKSGNFAMRFPIKTVEAHEPDETMQSALAGPGMDKALERDKTIDFWMSPDARWRFTSFCDSMGIDQEQDLISMAEELVASGKPFLLQGKNETDERDPTRVFFRLDNPAPLA